MARIRALCLILVVGIVVAACGTTDDLAADESSTTSTPAVATTQSSSTAATTTTTAAPSTTTTEAPETTTTAAAVELVVSWDGEQCSYEGPESLTTGTIALVTFHNDGDVPADLEIDYLASGVTLEEIVAAWPDELRSGDDVPTDANFVAGIPAFPTSADPGQSASADVTFAIPRLHSFVCWGGGTSSGVQTVDVAPTALTISDG